MRPFYLSTNRCGYYVVAFSNKETGTRTVYKSTHTKDYNEAMRIAMKWYTVGAPEKNTRLVDSETSDFDFNNLLQRLTSTEAKTLFDMLASKFGFSVPVQATADPTPQVAAPAVVVAPTPCVEAPKKKVVVVHKKNALSDSGMIPADVAAKVYEPLNPAFS